MPNVYVTPLQLGEPDIKKEGYIKALVGGEKYPIAKITYELYWNEEYQYVFEPLWDLIYTYPVGIFIGIPGIDTDLNQEKYYRVNMIPGFIKQRTPDRNRQGLMELMLSVGLNHYDRFEFLLRTDMTCGNDNLIVERTL